MLEYFLFQGILGVFYYKVNIDFFIGSWDFGNGGICL